MRLPTAPKGNGTRQQQLIPGRRAGRWPNRAALGVAAYRQLAEDRLNPPDTGDLRGDVLTLPRRINDDLSIPNARILRGLLAGVNDEPELLARLHEQIAEGGAEIWLTIVRRAVARGRGQTPKPSSPGSPPWRSCCCATST